MRFVAFGTYDTARHPRFAVVLEGLRAHGDTVNEVNAPLGFDTSRRVSMAARPWTALPFLGRLLGNWLSLARRARRVVRSGPVDAIVVGYMGHFDVLFARLLFRRHAIVLDHLIFAEDTIRDRGIESGLIVRLLGWLDRAAVAAADVVIVDTDEHLAMLPAGVRSRAVVVPVGASEDWLKPGAAEAELPPRREGPLRVIFFGTFTPLQGAPVIAAALGELADTTAIQTTMVGHGQDRAESLRLAGANPHVRWVDWIDHRELPGIVAAHDVCLGIFGTSPKAVHVVPNKVYQGAAAGRAIVTSDTDPQRRALGDAALYVPPGDAGELARVLRRLAADASLVDELKRRAASVAEEKFAPSRLVSPIREMVEVARR